jgi:hypothetical protein
MEQTYSSTSLIEESDSVDSTFHLPADRQNLADAQPQWSLATRIALRFAFVYLRLYCTPFVLYLVPYVRYLPEKYSELVEKVVPWVARHILHLQSNISFAMTGSSDTTF